MKTRIMFERSREWVKQARLETGESIPDVDWFEVDTVDLGQDARRILLEASLGRDHYADEYDLRFHRDYSLSNSGGHGACRPVLDCLDPTLEQLEAALLLAVAQVAEKRAEYEAREKQRQAELAEEHRQKEDRKARFTAARELLAGELKERDQAEADRDLLGELLQHIESDAVKAGLESLIESRCQAVRDDIAGPIRGTIEQFVNLD